MWRLGRSTFWSQNCGYGRILASRRRGRPGKGTRAVVKALVPPELEEAAAGAAKAHGMTANDYIAGLIAADIGQIELLASIQEKETAAERSAESCRSGP